jgi:hypothetical protein
MALKLVFIGKIPSESPTASPVQFIPLLSCRGQQFAQQIQQQNPELIEQLRNHIRSRSFSSSADEHS